MLPHCEKHRAMIAPRPPSLYATILSFTARKTVEQGGGCVDSTFISPRFTKPADGADLRPSRTERGPTPGGV